MQVCEEEVSQKFEKACSRYLMAVATAFLEVLERAAI